MITSKDGFQCSCSRSASVHPTFECSVPHSFLHEENTTCQRVDGNNKILTRPRHMWKVTSSSRGWKGSNLSPCLFLMLDTWFFTSNLFENSHAMWLENAKQVLISYINVWYFQEKKSHTGPCPQKVGDKGGGGERPQSGTKLPNSQRTWVCFS